MRILSYLLLAITSTNLVHAQLAPNAPTDQSQGLTAQQIENYERAIAPYVHAARETYPAARARFLHGLPSGQHFFAITRLVDSAGRWEQVFIRVATINGEAITGFISSDLNVVSGFKAGQSYSFKEPALIDWVITKPDGSEEGNAVGKFLDTYHP